MRLALALTKEASPLQALPLLFDARRALDEVLVGRVASGPHVEAESVRVPRSRRVGAGITHHEP